MTGGYCASVNTRNKAERQPVPCASARSARFRPQWHSQPQMTKGAGENDGTADNPERAAKQRNTADTAAQADGPATYGCAHHHVTGQQASGKPMLNICTSPFVMARTSTSFWILFVQPVRGDRQRRKLLGTRLQLEVSRMAGPPLYLQLATAHGGMRIAWQCLGVALDHLVHAGCALGRWVLSQAAMVHPTLPVALSARYRLTSLLLQAWSAHPVKPLSLLRCGVTTDLQSNESLAACRHAVIDYAS
jgi:hypothetical protein